MIDYNAQPPVPTRTVRRLRDVLLVPSPDDDGELDIHPPAGLPPVELGRGAQLTQQLSYEEITRIMDACEPRGENFRPTRNFGCLYAFVREIPPEEYMHSAFEWDHDNVLLACFTLSRLIRDNAYSTEYAASVAEFSDGSAEIVPGPVNQEGALAYRAHTGRDWLDAGEAAALAALLDSYWRHEDEFGPRISNAMWLAEQSARRNYDFDALLAITAGLEALVNTGPRQISKQFRQRVPNLAAEAGVSGLSRAMAGRLYEQRSDAAHGRRLRLVSRRPDEPAPNYDERETRAITELALIQDALRGAVRKCIQEPAFAAHFADDDGVRARWPVLDGDGNPL